MRASTGHSLTAGRTLWLPPELARSAPRDVGLTAGGRALMLTACLLVAGAAGAGVALYLEAQRQWQAAADLDGRGVRATAVVDRVWRKTGDGKPAYAAFHFEANGARIDGEARMQLSPWRDLRPGSAVGVRYLPDDPRRFVVDGQRRGRMPVAVAFVIPSVMVVIALVCLAPVRWQRTLLSDGRPAVAVVTSVRKGHGSSGETSREMAYEFRVLAGTIATGKASASKAMAVGDTLSVVYDPERPKRNKPYPFSLVTLKREW